MEFLVKTYANKNDIIFNPFMWSGIIGLTCKNLNRNFIGIELDKKYFAITKERIEKVIINNFIDEQGKRWDYDICINCFFKSMGSIYVIGKEEGK